MSIQKMYTVFDAKASAYLPLMFFRANGEAIRAFTAALRDPDHMFCKHAGDFTLFFVGQWHEGSCQFTIEPAPVNLGNGLEFQTRESAKPAPGNVVQAKGEEA